jgi:hypothetical protein
MWNVICYDDNVDEIWLSADLFGLDKIVAGSDWTILDSYSYLREENDLKSIS